MRIEQSDDLMQELVLSLEACRERIQSIQQEAERGLMLVNLALGTAMQARTGAVTRNGLREMLDAHHDRVTDSILSALQSGAPGTDPHGLGIDPDARTARIGRRHLPLTEAEYKVLELLWTRSPNIVSRRMLLDHLYGGKNEPSEEVLDVFIFHIRQKLKNGGCTDAAVESVRGRGWYLDIGRGPVTGEAASAGGEDAKG